MRAYLCSPYNGGKNERGLCVKEKRIRNVKYAQGCMKTLLEAGHSVFAPHLLYTQVLNEDIKIERDLGLAAGREFLKYCDALVLCGKYGVSDGMMGEMREATKYNVKIIGLTQFMEWAKDEKTR